MIIAEGDEWQRRDIWSQSSQRGDNDAQFPKTTLYYKTASDNDKIFYFLSLSEIST